MGGSPGLTPQLLHAPLGVARGEQALGPAGQLLDVPPVLLHRALLPQVPLQHHDGALFVLGGGQHEHRAGGPVTAQLLQVPRVGETRLTDTHRELHPPFLLLISQQCPHPTCLPSLIVTLPGPAPPFCSVKTSSIPPAFRAPPPHLSPLPQLFTSTEPMVPKR